MDFRKNILPWIFFSLSLAVISFAFVFYFENLQGIGPVIKPPVGDIVEEIENQPEPGKNDTNFPLKLPDGFTIEIFARDLPGARVMEFDTFGNMWVSQTSKGTVSLLEVENGKAVRQNAVFRNLSRPHGLAFHPEQETLLYIAEENKVSRVPTYSDPRSAVGFGEASGRLEKILDLPGGGGHYTRTVIFGPDGRLYTSIGSTCNVCNESDSRRAKIFSSNDDGSNFQQFARGLRNAVFMAWQPGTKNMWVTEMGRDLLGDDIPPDEINIIPIEATNNSGLSVADQNPDKNYGWPTCYGKNIHDSIFDADTRYIRNPCMEPFEIASHVDLQAHSAPLGLAFIPSSINWPKEYEDDLIVAYHGSWNRSVPTGYKLVRVKLGPSGEYQGIEDFISGWLVPQGALGRPVDVKFGPDGNLYVSDDKAGVIYRIMYGK